MYNIEENNTIISRVTLSENQIVIYFKHFFYLCYGVVSMKTIVL